jgi:excisionase family DNA binding protein
MATSSKGLSEPVAPAMRRAWFTPESLASYLQVSERMVRKWVAQGRLRSYKLDGCRRFDPADVDAFVAQFRDEQGRGR